MLDLRPAQGPRIVLQLSSHNDRLTVRVIESPVGEEVASDIVLQHIDEVLRMASQSQFHEDVGRGLFRSLFPGGLGELYRAAYAQAASSGQPLHVELRFDRDLVPVARYPWELLHDGTRSVIQAGAVSLVRYLTFPEPPRPLTSPLPLDLLVVSAHPKDQPPLASEFRMMEQAFEPLIQAKKLDLAYLLPPTWDALMDWMLAGAPGVLHFEGHGAFDETGMLVFENEDGDSDPVKAVTLAHAFYGTGLRLAVLSACESAKAAGSSLLSSVAPSLILAGIPAVIAMQRSLPDAAAVRFSHGFYTALLAGQDLETAVMAGRKQLLRSEYWFVPTLYLRSRPTARIKRAYLERRVDTAGPRAAPVDFPMRFGLWIRRPDSPTPDDDELRRLLGLAPHREVEQRSTRAPMEFPVETGQIQPGLVSVKLIAPGCEIHSDAVKHVTVFPDFDTPPVWFPLTPRRTGMLDLIVELSQNGAVVATAAHTLRITRQAEETPTASVKSQTVTAPDAAPEAAQLQPAPAPQPSVPKPPAPVAVPPPPAPPALEPVDSMIETDVLREPAGEPVSAPTGTPAEEAPEEDDWLSGLLLSTGPEESGVEEVAPEPFTPAAESEPPADAPAPADIDFDAELDLYMDDMFAEAEETSGDFEPSAGFGMPEDLDMADIDMADLDMADIGMAAEDDGTPGWLKDEESAPPASARKRERAREDAPPLDAGFAPPSDDEPDWLQAMRDEAAGTENVPSLEAFEMDYAPPETPVSVPDSEKTEQIDKKRLEEQTAGPYTNLIIHVVPGADAVAIYRLIDGSGYEFRLTASDTTEIANSQLLVLLAYMLRVNAAQINILTGLDSADKIIGISGISPDMAENALATYVNPSPGDSDVRDKVSLGKFDTSSARYGASFSVRLRTGANTAQIVGMEDEGAIVINVTEPANRNRINAELIQLLASILQIEPERIEVAPVADPRQRIVSVGGITLIDTVRILSAQLGDRPPDPSPATTPESAAASAADTDLPWTEPSQGVDDYLAWLETELAAEASVPAGAVELDDRAALLGETHAGLRLPERVLLVLGVIAALLIIAVVIVALLTS
ncbi:MAG: CHAT domain-containing protein [Anaerolineae bacterium]|nr:CHAT domain-containing protein [Anaerolineae bacterium]